MTGYLIYKIDVIPNKYLFYIITIYSLVLLFISLLIILKTNIIIKYLITGFNIILILGLIFTNVYLLKTLGFLDNLMGKYKIEEYSLIVLKDKITNIKELENKQIGITKNTSNKVINELKKEISYNSVEEDLYDLGNKLLSNDIDALLVLSSFKDILEEENELFKDQIIVIKTIEIKNKVIVQNIDIDIANEPFNVYISGLDIYGNISNISRSDVNIIATVNPKTHEVLLTYIPRDYYVTLDTFNQKDKLTHSGVYGIDNSVKTIENLLNIDIKYYVKVNFTTLVKLVDELGTLEVYSDYAFTNRGYSYVKGINKMDGAKALVFARERYTLPGGDRARGKNQERIIEAIIKKVSNSKTLLTNYLDFINIFNNNFSTNISSKEISKLVKKQLETLPTWKVESISLDGYGAFDYTYTYGKTKLYVMIPDENTITNAKEKINNVLINN